LTKEKFFWHWNCRHDCLWWSLGIIGGIKSKKGTNRFESSKETNFNWLLICRSNWHLTHLEHWLADSYLTCIVLFVVYIGCVQSTESHYLIRGQNSLCTKRQQWPKQRWYCRWNGLSLSLIWVIVDLMTKLNTLNPGMRPDGQDDKECCFTNLGPTQQLLIYKRIMQLLSNQKG